MVEYVKHMFGPVDSSPIESGHFQTGKERSTFPFSPPKPIVFNKTTLGYISPRAQISWLPDHGIGCVVSNKATSK